MTFEEFREMLEEYEIEVDKTSKEYSVYYKELPVATYYTRSSRIFLEDEFYELSNVRKGILLKALAKYIEELTEKKFKYKVPEFLRMGDWDYLNESTNLGTFIFSSDANTDNYQTHFTDAEMEELIEKHGELLKVFIELCEKVEVE